MQHYIFIKPVSTTPQLSLDVFRAHAQPWQRKAHALRIRRERALKQKLMHLGS